MGSREAAVRPTGHPRKRGPNQPHIGDTTGRWWVRPRPGMSQTAAPPKGRPPPLTLPRAVPARGPLRWERPENKARRRAYRVTRVPATACQEWASRWEQDGDVFPESVAATARRGRRLVWSGLPPRPGRSGRPLSRRSGSRGWSQSRQPGTGSPPDPETMRPCRNGGGRCAAPMPAVQSRSATRRTF